MEEIAQLFSRVHISLDGSSADIHDTIRGRNGSFNGAMRALELLDRVAAERRRSGGERLWFGIDSVVLQSNFPHLERLCSEVAPRFAELAFLFMGAGIPAGLASRASFAEAELLTEEQLAVLRDPALEARLRALAPSTVESVTVSDNALLRMSPEQLQQGTAATSLMQIEPDGGVRSLAIYEGTVGNILHEPPEVIWQRAQERFNHPFVVQALSGVRTMTEWAQAVRQIDQHFASKQDQQRIARRPEYRPGSSARPLPTFRHPRGVDV